MKKLSAIIKEMSNKDINEDKKDKTVLPNGKDKSSMSDSTHLHILNFEQFTQSNKG